MKKTENKKRKGGRNKISEKEIRKRHYLYLNEDEYSIIKQMQIELGHKKFSEAMRYILLKRADKITIANPVEALKSLDKIGRELNKIGNNFNQFAKYANQFNIISKFDNNLIEEFNKNFEEYKTLKIEVIKNYKKIISNF